MSLLPMQTSWSHWISTKISQFSSRLTKVLWVWNGMRLRLFVLLTAVVCCNACKFIKLNNQDTTGSEESGCSDSDGNFHEFYSDWENGPETCVCVEFGIICCKKFGDGTVPPIPESTPGIIIDYFGAFTENDVVETEELSDELLAAPEVVAEDSHEPAEDSHESAEDSHEPAEDSHESAEDSHESAEDSHESAEDSHEPAEDSE